MTAVALAATAMFATLKLAIPEAREALTNVDQAFATRS